MLPDASVVPADGGNAVQPIAYARTGVGVSVGSFSFALEAVANVHLRRTHYDVIQDGVERELVVPWLVQSGVAATLAW